MKEDQKRYLGAIAQASLQGKLVILVGAGVSMNSGYPDWYGLAGSTCYLLPSTAKRDMPWIKDNLLDYFEQFEELKKKRELKDGIKKIFSSIPLNNNYIHELIFGLNPCAILTTNYDELLEHYDRLHGNNYHVIRKNSHTLNSKLKRTLVKMHGDFHTDNIIITKTDYKEYSQDYSFTLPNVTQSIAENTLLLVGFSGNDPNVNTILENIKKVLKNDSPPVYLLSSSITDDFKNNELIKNQTIVVINPIDNDNFTTIISAEDARNRHEKKRSNLGNEKGENISNILFYIQYAVKVEDEETKIDQLIKEMEFYKNTNYLLKDHFEKILSYIGISTYIYYDDWAVSDKLFDQIEGIKESDPIRYNEFIRSLLTFNLKKVIAKESSKFIDITNIEEQLSVNNEFDNYYSEISERLIKYDQVFNYKKVQEELNVIKLEKNSEYIKLALLCAQHRQILGQHKEALEILLEYDKHVENLWDSILIKLNISSVHNAAFSNFIGYREIETDELFRIKEMVSSFDLGRYMDNKHYKIPSHFRSFVISTFERLFSYEHWAEIKQLVEKMEDDYQTIEKGGWVSHSPQTIDLLNYRFEIYDVFTTGNHLPIYFWWQDKIVVEEYTKGILTRYAADNVLPKSHIYLKNERFYRIELPELKYDMIIRIIGSDGKVLNKLITHYKILDCNINSIDLEKLVSAFNNLVEFSCEFNRNWHLLNLHQYQIYNFLTIFSILPSAITIKLWKIILNALIIFIKTCEVNPKFITPFESLIKSIPISILDDIKNEMSDLVLNFVKAMMYVKNGELLQSQDAGRLQLIIIEKIAQNEVKYVLNSKFEDTIRGYINNWTPDKSFKTPEFALNILLRCYYFVSEDLQLRIKDFIVSRFKIDEIHFLIETFYSFSFNLFIDFDNQIKKLFLDSVFEMISSEDDNLPLGYTKEGLITYLRKLEDKIPNFILPEYRNTFFMLFPKP